MPSRTLAAVLMLCAAGALLEAQRPFEQRDIIPDGSRVEYKTFRSELLARDLRYGIYLPPSYTATNRRFPVLYFLHGLNENEMRWSTRGLTDLKLDQMIRDKEISEFIVAIPFGATSFYTNYRDGSERWEDMLVSEFLPLVESNYRVQAGRQTRGISGISMGGFGALKIAMRHTDRFGSVSAHSAVLLADLQAANIGGRRLQFLSSLFDRVFGISRDLTYWQSNNPLALVSDTKALKGLKIYFDCGSEDEYGFAAGTKLLADTLAKANYPHEAHIYPGDHGWDYAKQHTGASLKFHARAFEGK